MAGDRHVLIHDQKTEMGRGIQSPGIAAGSNHRGHQVRARGHADQAGTRLESARTHFGDSFRQGQTLQVPAQAEGARADPPDGFGNGIISGPCLGTPEQRGLVSAEQQAVPAAELRVSFRHRDGLQ